MTKHLIEEITDWLADFEKTQPHNVDIDTDTFDGSAYYLLADAKATLLVLESAIKTDLETRKDVSTRKWKCQDETCPGTEMRDYETLVECGSPYCPICDGDMELVKLA